MLFPLHGSDRPGVADFDQHASARHDPLPNMLYVMVKPSTDLADTLWKYPETQRNRPASLLHTTIQPIGSRQWLTDSDIAACQHRLSQVRHAPFFLSFDRVRGGHSLALSAGAYDNCAAQDFRCTILDALSGHFRQLYPYDLDPHMTLDYRGGRPGRLLPQPIAWRVEEFVLVESVHGETRHIEWGRWPLNDQ